MRVYVCVCAHVTYDVDVAEDRPKYRLKSASPRGFAGSPRIAMLRRGVGGTKRLWSYLELLGRSIEARRGGIEKNGVLTAA